MKYLFCFLIISIAACGKKHSPNDSLPARAPDLWTKKNLYCERGKMKLQEKGFLGDRCDSLLFTSLWSVACGEVDLTSWEEPGKPGFWHRSSTRDCFVNGVDNGSKTSISKDMFLGLFHHIWHYKKADMARRTADYGRAHSWIMGDGINDIEVLSRTLLSPGLVQMLYDILGKFGQDVKADIPVAGPQDVLLNQGFRAHLDILAALLRLRLYGKVSDFDLWTIREQARREPHNALYVALASRFDSSLTDKAAELLLSDQYFPSDSLPTSANYCTSYIYQRDEGQDWLPCPETGAEHDGVDFVFAASVIDGTL